MATEGILVLQVQRTLISAERSSRQKMASLIDGGFSNERTHEANGATPKAPRLSQDSPKIISLRLLQIGAP